ncbi:hypothetical protein GQ43DRAFT_219585 [Delitschia confertaspora ATCC 74209]|uniref:Uncharacterized protein n=1 Tax=Delitschia confertaspora ATCC 74209 TaxID=1513339 RepID=A0A9P4JD02_9PLEO|nr:hypothetical protein GQ43DRAFT_219585 [Delitschia confertaspora ATCC 74209]
MIGFARSLAFASVGNLSVRTNETSSAGPAITATLSGFLFPNSSWVPLTSTIANASKPLNSSAHSNATLCWSDYWYSTESYAAWYRSRSSLSTLYSTTWVQTISLSTPVFPTPTGNASSNILCDGLPRFNREEEASRAFKPVTLPTPIITTMSTTYLAYNFSTPPGATLPYPHVKQTCSASSPEECQNIWSLFSSSIGNSWSAWSTDNVFTISLASPPISITVNGETTPLTMVQGSDPVLTIHGETYSAIGNIYSISGATNFFRETTLAPGEEATFTWNWEAGSVVKSPPIDPICTQTFEVISSQCATAQCTISAYSFELMYFAPPSTTRNICANTSPGYDSCKCLIP